MAQQSSSRQTWRVVTWAMACRMFGAYAIFTAGFRAVSDDDFARVVIAQKFAVAPQGDPTGTSWLPLPFWLLGSLLSVCGTTLETARFVSVLITSVATAALGVMAHRVGMGFWQVATAIGFVSFMPWGMQLAVATVPEAMAAAFATAGILSLATSNPRLRLWGGLALCISCLSRYDAWAVALGFSLLCAVDASRRTGKERALLVFAALVALAGPALWSLWQWRMFGDPLRYLRLVSSYRRALGNVPPLSDRMFGYPLGFLHELREVLLLIVVGLFAWLRTLRIDRSSAPSEPTGTRWGRPLSLAAFQFAILILGDVRNGAPTHHPERALLTPASIVVFASFDRIFAALVGTKRQIQAAFWATSLVLFAGWTIYRTQHSLPWYSNATRSREIAAGKALRQHVESGRVLLDTRDFEGGGIDYGYYAVIAGFGSPANVVIDRDQDPRKPKRVSSFSNPTLLANQLRAEQTKWMLTWGETRMAVATQLGARVVAEEATSANPRWFLLVKDVENSRPVP